MPRPLHEIADEIQVEWDKVNYAAAPYLYAMCNLNTIDEMYGHDSAKSIVLYFLSNANTWRGKAARRIKKELKSIAGVK